MDVQIIKKDGTKYNLIDYNCIAKDIIVESIELEENKKTVDGRSGYVDYGADYRSRVVKVPITFKATDRHDFALLRDELHGILTDAESYYIRELRKMKRDQYKFVDTGQTAEYEEGTENIYVNGKQILVRLANTIEWKQSELYGTAVLEYETTELPFFETVYRSTFLHDNQYYDEVETFGLADNINDENLNYRFNTSTFTVWNASNVTVSPLEMDFNIIVRNLTTSGNFTIKNLTTGDTYIYKSSVNNQTLTLDNGLTMISGLNQQINANTEYITLAPGNNNFAITNGTFTDITIDTKFYYK